MFIFVKHSPRRGWDRWSPSGSVCCTIARWRHRHRHLCAGWWCPRPWPAHLCRHLLPAGVKGKYPVSWQLHLIIMVYMSRSSAHWAAWNVFRYIHIQFTHAVIVYGFLQCHSEYIRAYVNVEVLIELSYLCVVSEQAIANLFPFTHYRFLYLFIKIYYPTMK